MRSTIITTAKQFKAYRARRKLTQQALAQQIGVTSAAVSNWEHGRRRIEAPISRLIWFLEKHGPVP